MTRLTASAPAPFGLPASAGSLTAWSRAVRVLQQWSGRRRSRIALARLDDRLLRDAGLDALMAEAEVAEPFWR
ncbi:MAG: DUF1127 domain-containing protein [Albidovulum sp.]|uniref:DUF1127 domain-containing protein n=1 Tax=Albidovulum sp. TaxID=1872424 RepID=UPI001329E27F|nr:DUF1127 domain-containing protein [Defluviimonas sp.]KAB2884163.1 MAG: DUF1127 domain-containing protein [Defluviimonas sp.]